MTIAIQTSYAGPTETKGRRIRAQHLYTRKVAYVSWDHAAGIDDNHRAAAERLAYATGASVFVCRCPVAGGGWVWVWQ